VRSAARVSRIRIVEIRNEDSARLHPQRRPIAAIDGS
jgi:hypothetical protein